MEACDLGVTGKATSWIAGAEAAHGPIDVVVNNAGIEMIGLTDELPAEEGIALLELNSRYEPTFWARNAPFGDVDTLARRMPNAADGRRERVIYPRIYALGRWFPPLAAWLTAKVAPNPQRLVAPTDLLRAAG
ncbi:MAG: hypothetical protein ABI321_14785 [Polyangia bacterium]